MCNDFVHIDLPRWMTEKQTDELDVIISDIIGDGVEAGTPAEHIRQEIREEVDKYLKEHQP